nr:MAG TPA: hypothetical protein [Caudoviricetes sp.]
MALFGKKEEKPTTLEEVRKAYENLSDDDKKSFHQSITDRVHESIGEQEAENGQKDEQTAADREHEALGEEHADGEDKDKGAEKKREEKEDKYAKLIARLEALEAHFKESGDGDKEAARKAEQIYGVGNGVFAADRTDEKTITPKEASEIARKYKI